MKLNYQSFPAQNKNLNMIILHGLFGSSKNWITISKELSKFVNVYALDLRNHGNSPHSTSHTLKDMIEDLKEFIEDHQLQNIILLGHSMGGLVVMGYGLQYPENIEKIIVVDIAPKIYLPHHEKEFEVLQTDVSNFSNREEIDKFLSKIHPDPLIRQFLMMNLHKTNKGYEWKINVEAIKKGIYLDQIPEFLNNKSYIKTLFIKASNSNYITREDYKTIKHYFPNAEIIEIEGNHWIHYSNTSEFLKQIIKFINYS